MIDIRRASDSDFDGIWDVSTNERAVALWQRMGFAIVGTLPKAFRHSRLGLVDAYVMHRTL